MLSLIRIFIKVVDQGSFSKAGSVLNMAPSSIARNIDKLESDLSVTLFKRSTRQLVLTEDGKHFYEGAYNLLEEADNLVDSMHQLNQEPEGRLRISSFESFGRQCISPLLPEFLQRYPKVKIEMELENRLVDLNSENTDLGIRIGRPEDSSLNARLLMANKTLLCASPAYIEQFGMPKTPEDLSQHNCLRLSHGRQITYWHFHNAGDYKKIAVQGNLTSKGGTPLLEASIHGGGIVLMSRWMMQDLIDQGKLVQCLPHWQAQLHENSSGDIYAVYKGSKYLRPALRALIDFIAEKVQH